MRFAHAPNGAVSVRTLSRSISTAIFSTSKACDGKPKRGETIWGGEDENIADADARDAKLADKSRILSRKLGALLPAVYPTPRFAWAGSFGTGTPTVGRIPRMPNCYAAMGYGGSGITFSMMAAQILRTMLLGSSDPDGDLMSFHRPF